jgi:putative heme-binding domain-containing protein
LNAVEAGNIPQDEFQSGELTRLALHHDADIDARVGRIWGTFRGGTPEEKLAEVRRFNNDLRAASGDAAKGRALFTQHCALCHRLFDEGRNVGPDLTQANRKDTDYLLVSIVDPNVQIRREYASFIAEMKDGRVLNGLLADQTPATVTLLASNEERTTVPRDEIAELRESPISLMPEDLISKIRPQELRDLFAYLQSDRPVK